jgi:hypothetical protein
MPVTRSTRRTTRTSPARAARRGSTAPSNIGFSSRGGPGKSATTRPSCST